MDKNYLIINVGSSSKRYSLFNETKELYTEYIEKNASKTAYRNSLHNFLVQLTLQGFIETAQDITAVAFRVVAPGNYFMQHKKITASYLEKLTAAAEIAPLHIESVLEEISKCKQLLPKVPLYAISDSAFHTTLPEVARIYAVPKNFAKKQDIYRFGYHGISCSSIVHKVKNLFTKPINTVIICHLSGGSSVTAIKNGNSIDTSMGYTPLEGVPMVSRVGNIDAGAIIALQNRGFTSDQLKKLLFNESGMIGLTNQNDMRAIVARAEKGDTNCLSALQLFAYQIKKYIGAYKAIVGNLDLLVFTGGIGEGSAFVRSLVCSNLETLNIVLNEQKNKKIIDSDDIIHDTKSKTKIAVFKTQEMHEMVKELKILVKAK